MLQRYTAIFVGALLSLCGCASNTAPPPQQMEQQLEFADEYVIGIGDNLQVNVWRHDDLSVSTPVRPDGKITVPIAGDVMVGGRTPEAVSEVIAADLQDYIRDPVVTVIVTNIGSAEYLSRVRVTGAVESPSSFLYRQGMTVMDAVLDAGGLTEFANASKANLYRATGERLNVRLDRILRKGDLSTNFPLRPGDVITVPERIF